MRMIFLSLLLGANFVAMTVAHGTCLDEYEKRLVDFEETKSEVNRDKGLTIGLGVAEAAAIAVVKVGAIPHPIARVGAFVVIVGAIVYVEANGRRTKLEDPVAVLEFYNEAKLYLEQVEQDPSAAMKPLLSSYLRSVNLSGYSPDEAVYLSKQIVAAMDHETLCERGNDKLVGSGELLRKITSSLRASRQNNQLASSRS